MKKILFLILTVINGRSITLTDKNSVSLIDTVNEDSISKIIHDIYEISYNKEKNMYIYLNTPGGSVDDGNRLIETINYLKDKKNISCIAHNIASMGFVILQACPYRLGLTSSKVMQHQISTMLSDEKQRLKTYMNYIDSLEKELIHLQADRIKISYNKFIENTYHNWWLTGKDALKNNIIDEIVTIGCGKSLLKTNIKANVSVFTNIITIKTFSKCPLIHKPIDIKYETK